MSTEAGPRETAGVTTRLIVSYVRAHAGSGAVADLLALAGDDRPLAVLEDERVWSTYAQRTALFAAAAEVLDDPDVGLHIGEWILKEQIGLPIRMVLLALGSPRQLFRNAEKAATKFSTMSDLKCVRADATSATLTYQLHPGYEPHVQDCGYAIGLLSQVPALFGLPPATVVHDRCQVRGAPMCVYELTWSRRARFGRRRRRLAALERELRMMTQEVESLQRVAADIVAARDIADTIERIAGTVTAVVRAAGHMVVMQPLAGGEPVVRSSGLTEDEAAELAAALLEDEVHDTPQRIVVDLTSGDRRYGRIAAVSPGDDPFFPDERRLLAAFGGLAASAIDAAVSRETTRVLSELAQSLANITSSAEMSQRIAEALPLIIGAPVGAVANWNSDEEALQFVGVHGFSEELTSALRAFIVRPDDTPLFREQLASPTPRLWLRDSADEFVTAMLGSFDVEAAISVPVMARGELLGHVIAGWHSTPPRMFAGELIARMEGVAGQAASALQNAQLLERTTYQALHDSLTGLPNRVLLEDRLQQAAARARRDANGVAVLLVDLDGFKAVNDTFGHRAGDDVLREVAERLTSLLRDTDTAARLGGDEFVLVCQDIIDDAAVANIVARVEAAVSEPIKLPEGIVVVGASVGVAAVEDPICDMATLLARADAAMYGIKRSRPVRAPRLSAVS